MNGDSAAVPDSVRPVVARWNPAGVSRDVGACSDTPSGGAQIFVVGLPRCGRSEVEDAFRSVPGYVTVERAADAIIALLVVDAASVIGREELELLDAAAVRGLPFALVVTKVDRFEDWEAVCERDLGILAGHSDVYRTVTVIPISGSERAGSERSGREGYAALLAVVDEVRVRALAQPRNGVIAETRRMIDLEIRNLRESAPGADLLAERAQLLTERDGRRSERLAQMRSRLQRARADLMQQIADTTRMTVASARTWIDESTRIELLSLPARLEHEVESNTMVFDAAMSIAVGADENSASLAVPRFPAGPVTRPRGNEERITVLVGASAGLGLGRIAVTPLEMVPALDIASIPVTLLLGAVAAWWLSRARGVAADRAHARTWVVETMATVRAQWEQRVLHGLLDAEVDLGSAIMTESRELVASAQSRITEIDTELSELGRARSGQLAACERDLAILNGSGARS